MAPRNDHYKIEKMTIAVHPTTTPISAKHPSWLSVKLFTTSFGGVVFSYIQGIGCQPEKNYFTRWPILLVVC